MSFLTPLFFLAGLAVGLPILFHMIRRTPQNRQVFGSVMFLSPSLPKTSRRSRIEDWLLLLLRVAAICLLAMAFARPYLKGQDTVEDVAGTGDRWLILVDRSASMGRDDYWNEAIDLVSETLKEVTANDDVVSLQLFDRSATPLMTFEEWGSLTESQRISQTLERLRSHAPGWMPTELGQVLMSAAEQIHSDSAGESQQKTLVVVSDFQSGSHWEALNGYAWPEDVKVRVLRVGNDAPRTNAAIHVIHDENRNDETVRIRVMNSADAEATSFQVGWLDEFRQQGSEFVSDEEVRAIEVLPGQNRVLSMKMPSQEGNFDRLKLQGDEIGFDNLCYITPRVQQDVTILYLGENGEGSSPSDLKFFLQPMFPGTVQRNVQIADWNSTDPAPGVSEELVSLLIVGGSPDLQQTDWIRNYLARGGAMLFVARNADQGASVYDLLSLPMASVEEDDGNGYAMMGEVNFSHPVMALFNDPRFSDFTKLRFWKHRRYLKESFPALHLLASYDDGAIALAEIPGENSRTFLLTSGWNRDDSELAVWSKFVPLMNRILEEAIGEESLSQQLTVGQTFSMGLLPFKGDAVWVQIGDEKHQQSLLEPLLVTQPGIYRFAMSEQDLASDNAIRMAANLPPSESRTDPVTAEMLQSTGVRLEELRQKGSARSIDPAQQRILMNQEQEARQQIWRWLLLIGLGVLLLESAWSGWRNRPVWTVRTRTS